MSCKSAPEKGKWVILKSDSSHDTMNIPLMEFYFPGVPNKTVVYQQETDQNYGPFKGQYRNNRDRIVEAWVNQNKTTSLPA